MALIVDKRLLPKNSTSNSRQKFIDRYKGAIKKRIRQIVNGNSIKDFAKGDKKVKIKIDDLDEPSFSFEAGTGSTERIYVGNKHFKKGDTIDKDKSGNQRSGGAGNGSGGEDDFEFVLTEKEFSDLFFEDLELPDLLKKEFIGNSWEIKHAGFSRYGGPSSLNIRKTMLNALGRRIALKSKNKGLVRRIEKELAAPKKKIQYIEDIDLRYNFKDKVDMPSTKAVMICLMDVSGSMGEYEKDLAKRFYILLNLFLKRNYSIVDVVFVRHADNAEEVDEKKFFYDRVSGGTVISSGYEKVNEIINNRYSPNQWNIYIAQTSDGDNFPDDNERMAEILSNKLLPVTQYFAYININRRTMTSYVYKEMEKLMRTNNNLQARNVDTYKDIFPVFRSLFKKKEGK